MKRLAMTVLSTAALTAAACDDNSGSTDTTTTTATDATTATDTTTTTTTDTTTTDTGGGGTSAITGVSKPSNPKAEPTADPQCAADQSNPVYAATSGFTYPWEGATIDGKTYTCNGCKTGDPHAQGSWRVHGFVNSDGTGDMDYTFPDPAADYAETLVVDGNTFESHIKDAKAGAESTVRGFYFCSMKPETSNAHDYWVVTESDDPEKPAGYVFETDVVLTGGTDNIVVFWYDEVGGATNQDFQYCRIGTKNPDNADQTCTNPFE